MANVIPENAIGIMLNKLLNVAGKDLLGMTALRNYVLQHQQLLDVPEPVKNDAKASQLRQQGNRLYLGKSYEQALKKYNESICYAEAGSDHLALGFANRSAVYYAQGEYEFALLNIRLARSHNYPEKLLENLETREKNCRKKIDEGLAKDNVPCPRMGINVEVNPKIPFLAKGVGIKQFLGSGRGLVAEQNFKAGDVILAEKTILSVVASPYKYLNCSHCGISNQHSLIPCPGCVSYMYCNEDCRNQGKQLHRFECGFGAQIENISINCSSIGPKMFFYGLQLFNGDLDQMMKYCEKNALTGADPFKLDYTKYDPLEEFKTFVKSKITINPLVELSLKLCAAASYVVLMKQPLVQKMVVSKSQKRFFLNLLYICQRLSSYFSWEFNIPTAAIASGLSYFGKLINHSCDPNAVAYFDLSRVKCVLIRPVRKGEQITFTLGPAWFVCHGPPVTDLSFKCCCTVCRHGGVLQWLNTGEPLPLNATSDLNLCISVMLNENANDAAKLNALQQIIQRYDRYLPNMQMSIHLRLYIEKLKTAMTNEQVKLNRAKIAAEVALF